MTDIEPTDPAESPQASTPAPDYSPLIGLKNCAWFTGIIAGVHQAMPGVIQGVTWLFGSPPSPTSPFSRGLPYVIAAVLFLAHDFAKLKSKFKWV